MRAGVSQSTVSYVLSGKRAISEETRKRVLDAVAELAFERNAGARALKGQRTYVLGLVIPSSTHDAALGQVAFIEAIALRAREHDFDVLVVTADEGADGIRRLARRRLCDGLILMELRTDGDDRMTVAEELGMPTMLIGVPRELGGLHCVDEDFDLAGSMCVGALAEAGVGRVIVLGYPKDQVRPDVNFVPRFYSGASAGAREADLPLDFVIPDSHSPAAVAAALTSVIEGGGGRIGLVISADSCVSAVYDFLARRGMEPGPDIALVAHCSEETAGYIDASLTRVLTSPRTVSNMAVDGLVSLLDDPSKDAVPSIQLHVPERLVGGTTRRI